MNYPQFVDNQTYYSMDTSRTELQQLVGLSNNLKKIHLLTTSNFRDFDQLIQEYLKTGLEIFNMKIGIVSRIDENDYIICNAISPEDAIKKDDVFPLEDTYCREVFHSKAVLGFPHVGGMNEMKDHPVYQNMKLESYISAPIYSNGVLFGTLNFTSTIPRKYGFSEHERDLISLMANSIGSFLELNQKESELIAANDRLKRLVGYVAHDLRNPLSSIHGLASFVNRGDEQQRLQISKYIQNSAENALEMVHTILETAAMGTGKIELKKTNADFSELISSVKGQFSDSIDEKNIRFELNCVQGLIVEIDPSRMEQVLTNLYSNAIKFTPDGGVISTTVSRSDLGMIDFMISNEMEEARTEKQIRDHEKSVGFGQDIVREILKLHDSELKILETGKEYKASFSI